MTDFNTYVDVLLFMENNFNKESCDYIYGNLSDHLFEKWSKSNNNILTFYTRLDKPNQNKLLTWGYNKYEYIVNKYIN